MKPIKVALVHIDNPRFMQPGRMVGMWSYDVPEFSVGHIPRGKYGVVNKAQMATAYNLIWQEDHRCQVTYTGGEGIPICYFVGDSTLSIAEYHSRREIAETMDAVFVDWDRLERFGAKDKGRVFRCSHSVNDHMFRDYGRPKDIDVGFYCLRTGPGGQARIEFSRKLEAFCKERGYIYDSAIRGGADYAVAMNRTRLVVQLGRNAETRAHRTFDAMACRACLVTDCLPAVSGEIRAAGEHYVEYHDFDELTATIDRLLSTGDWRRYADAGYELVQREHTWAKRATYLHGQLCEAFPWLKS